MASGRRESRRKHLRVVIDGYRDASTCPELNTLARRVRPQAKIRIYTAADGQMDLTVQSLSPPAWPNPPSGDHCLTLTGNKRTYLLVVDLETERFFPRLWQRDSGTLTGVYVTGIDVRKPAPWEQQLSAEKTAAELIPDIGNDYGQ